MKRAVGRSRLPQKLHMTTVPKSSELQPGSKVNIILKADQATGKLTTGHIADFLTKNNNHPHGIKVRLTDGQIGRVQSLSASNPSTLISDLPTFEPEQRLTIPSTSNVAATRGMPHQLSNAKTMPSTARMVQAFRQDGYDPDSRQQSASLLDYVRPTKQRKAAINAQRQKPQDQESPQVLLEDEFPNLDSALVAAILADYPTIEDAREVLKGLS